MQTAEAINVIKNLIDKITGDSLSLQQTIEQNNERVVFLKVALDQLEGILDTPSADLITTKAERDVLYNKLAETIPKEQIDDLLIGD